MLENNERKKRHFRVSNFEFIILYPSVQLSERARIGLLIKII